LVGSRWDTHSSRWWGPWGVSHHQCLDYCNREKSGSSSELGNTLGAIAPCNRLEENICFGSLDLGIRRMCGTFEVCTTTILFMCKKSKSKLSMILS
jgi:hypothetical protein